MPSTRELVDPVPQTGRVTWIGVRPGRGEPVVAVDHADAVAGRGLVGDRAAEAEADDRRKRQVTLIQAEHLPVIAALAGRGSVDPALLRRNVVVEGINLQSLTDRHVRVGETVLALTGRCHPCSKMEVALGEGGFQAMRGHGGWNARVVEGGTLRLGDEVVALARHTDAPEAEEV